MNSTCTAPSLRRFRVEEVTVTPGGFRLDKVALEPDPVIEVYKAHVDRTLIRENLKRSVEERFLNLMALQRFAEELRRAGREGHRP